MGPIRADSCAGPISASRPGGTEPLAIGAISLVIARFPTHCDVEKAERAEVEIIEGLRGT